MSSEQQPITEYTDEPDTLFGDIRDYVGGLYGRVQNTLADVGLDLDWWSKPPFNIQSDDDVWVYQYVVAYCKGDLGGRYDFDPEGGQSVRKGSPSPEIQFKTGIYVLGEPTDELERRIRDIDNPRLVTLFNTDVYAGYMDGFGFSEKNTYIQREKVSAREVQQKGYGLGVPWFEVEAYDEEGKLSGVADGYFNPFSTETETTVIERGEEAPQQEEWDVGARQKHESGDRYQIAPEGGTQARKRAKAAQGKTAVINGFEVGSILDGGRIRLKVEHKSPARATYASRKDILSGSGTPYQALSEGANIYKVQETDDRVIFSTKKPSGFNAPDPDDISPDAVGVETEVDEVTRILLDDDEPTQYTVETDTRDGLGPSGRSGRMLGLYDPIVVRDIENGTELV